MGVHGLWKLIDAAGKPVPVETLENKVLAVDVSIWLYQLVKGFQDAAGSSSANAHLQGLFYRICKLLFFRIKPVFVFDGGVPALKKRTIAARQNSRTKASESIEKTRQELLRNLIKQHALGKLLGKDVRLPKIGGPQSKADTLFYLPPLPSTSTEEKEIKEEVSDDERGAGSSSEESPSKYGDLHSIDVKSEEFRNLPADMRHDILSELKETRKQNSWGKLHLMPENMGEFSNFQMERLLKRRSVQVCLEETEKEMGPRGFTVSEIQEMLEFQGVDVTQRIASDSSTRFVFSSQRSPQKNVQGEKLASVKEAEDENSDIDDPLIDAMLDQEGMSQEDILKMIKEQQERKKADGKGNETASRNVNDRGNLTKDLIKQNNEACKPELGNLPQSDPVSRKEFDNKQVTQLLKDSAKKHLTPISELSRIIDPKKKKRGKRRKPVRHVKEVLNLSESDDSSEDEIPSKVMKTSLVESEASSEDEALQEVVETPLADTDSSSNDFIEVNAPAEKSVSLPKKEEPTKTPQKTALEIVLNLNADQFNEEDDLFKDVFESSTKPDDAVTTRGENNDQQFISSDSDSSEGSFVEVKNGDHADATYEFSSNKTKIPSSSLVESNITKRTERESILNELLEQKALLESDIKISKSPEVENLKDEIPLPTLSGKSEREKILDELLNTQKQLEKEVNAKDVTSSEVQKVDDIDLSEDKDVISLAKDPLDEKDQIETSEILKEKNYFGDNELAGSSKTVKHDTDSNFLSELMTVEQVRQYQSTLERESTALFKEKRREERVASSVSEQITLEAQELLRMFGIPWVVAPMEAEAQCAFLDIHGHTQGTITDDSDIWLFGAHNVYKNFFDQKKFVKRFKASDIEKVYKLGRDELIMVGLLVGSDYTLGLNGVGPVTALEIIANFPRGPNDSIPPRDRLARFADDLNGNKITKALARKLLSVQLTEGFPSADVVKAYTSPVVDESQETFSWGNPDIEKLKEYAFEKFGWDANKTNNTLEPIFDKLKQNRTQTTLHGFFDWAFDNVESKLSKRVEKAVHLLGSGVGYREQEESVDEPNETPRQRAARIISNEGTSSRRQERNDDDDVSQPGPSRGGRRRTRPEVNQTLEHIKKGKRIASKRKPKEPSIMKPNELDFEGPFDAVEVPKRNKVHRTDEEKWKEIEEARARAAKVLAKLKHQEQAPTNE